MIHAIRYHDISAGHRVVGHESKCQYLHGHNYRVHFFVEPVKEMDDVGRVLDFSVIKSTLCMFLENNYDHKMLIWEKDDMLESLLELSPMSISVVPFNPTAENIAKHLVEKIGPLVLPKTVKLVKVVIEETRKCSVEYSI